jgi:pimeloyl-ACP methyl ester carboxylesterase
LSAAVAGRTRYARHDGLRIAYAVRRSRWRRLPWMVLIQGLGFDRSGWAPVVAGLGAHFRLLLVDNRGSGRSDPPTGRMAVADMAGDVVAVLDHAAVPRAHVVGISLGGMIAQEVAVAHPGRVASLVLAGTTPGWPFAYPMPAETIALLAATGRMPADVAVRRHTENALGPNTVRHRPELVDRLVEAQRDRPGAAGWQAQLEAGARFGSLRQAAITAPTLVLHGGADRVVDPRNARLLADRIPGARLEVLPGLGHLFFWEEPQTFVEVVTDFARSPEPVATLPSTTRKDL